MRFEILLAPTAARKLQSLPAYDRSTIRQAIEAHLRYQAGKTSKSRIKRLRGLRQPQYRLRVNEFRVFYDIVHQEVQILAVIAKDEAQAWLDEHGTPET